MTDVELTWQETVDPAACNSNPNIYQQFSRDPARTPFQWDATANAGFSSGNKTWLPLAKNYTIVNVAVQQADPNSHLNIYKNLIAKRQTYTYQFGQASIKALSDNVLSIVRFASNTDPFYIVLINYGTAAEKVSLSSVHNLPNVRRKIRSIEHPEYINR